MPVTDELAQALAREVDCLQRLLAMLEQEHAALTTADIDALEAVTRTKNAAMAEQADLAAQRGRILTAAGYDSSSAGLQACIAASDDQTLTTTLDSLGELARQCQHFNRENGRIIVQKQQHARTALNILRQNEDAAAPTYSLRGLATNPEDSRTLGKA